MDEDHDGGYVVAGATVDTSTRSASPRSFASPSISSAINGLSVDGAKTDVYVVRVSPDGTVRDQALIGGPHYDYASGITRTRDGGYAISGYTVSYEDTSIDGTVTKLDEDLNVEWRRHVGVSAVDTSCWITSTKNGDIVAVDEMPFVEDGEQVAAVRLDPNGSVVWRREYGTNDFHYFNRVTEGPEGRLFFTGYTDRDGSPSTDSWILATGADGVPLWNVTFGRLGRSNAWHVSTGNDSLTVAGSMTDSQGRQNPYLGEMTLDGDVRWLRTYDSTGDTSHAVVRSDDGYLLAANGLKPDGASPGVQLFALDERGFVQGRTSVGEARTMAFWDAARDGDQAFFIGQRPGPEGRRAWLASFEDLHGRISGPDDASRDTFTARP